MLSGFFFRSAFVFNINSLILSDFPLTSFHLPEANLVPEWLWKNWKPLFRVPLTMKRCAWGKIEQKPEYILFHGFILLCVQLSKNITICFFLYNYSHFYYSFCNPPVLIEHIQSINKLQNNICTMHEIKNVERNQSINKLTSHSSYSHSLSTIISHFCQTHYPLYIPPFSKWTSYEYHPWKISFQKIHIACIFNRNIRQE